MKYLLSFLFAISAYCLSAQSVSPTKPVFAPGEAILINFSGFPGHQYDWISIAAKGLGDDKYTIWKYTGGSSGGTVTLDGLPYGEYEIRGYHNNGWTVIARSHMKVGN